MNEGMDVPRFAGIPVFTGEGQELPLGALWAEHPAVLVFVRHFGCLFCREQAAELREVVQPLSDLGAALALVGTGTPLMARDFQARYAPDLPVYANPDRQAFEAAGFRRGLWSTLSPRAVWRALGALRKGFRPGSVQGHPWQQGGVIVMTPPNNLVFRFASRYSGDHPNLEGVVVWLKSNLEKKDTELSIKGREDAR